jgi:predicted transcriptional regulator
MARSFDICARKHRGNQYSRAANDRTDKGIDVGRILSFFLRCENYEATYKDIERALGIPMQTASARLSDLKNNRLIEWTGRKREHCNICRPTPLGFRKMGIISI